MSEKEPKPIKPMKQILKESAIRALWLVAIVFILYLLQACGNKRLASVEERHTKGSQVAVNDNDDYSAVDEKISSYQVKPGDTLYSIAFRFGVDYQSLAKSNNINSNYLINVGQRLNIDAARNYQEPAVNTVAVNRKPKPVSVTRNTKPQTSRTKKPVTTSKPKPAIKPEVKPANTPIAKPTKQPTKKPVQSRKPKPSSTERKVDANNPVKFWIWPNMGKVTASFVGTGRKGIDIAGNIGDSVRASAAGRVVYAGRGLRGYGNLVIIKHNNSFISAYAHNRRILVKENEIIKAGQKIAELGNSDTDVPKLHFEIRYKGKPTDPLKYLPKR